MKETFTLRPVWQCILIVLISGFPATKTPGTEGSAKADIRVDRSGLDPASEIQLTVHEDRIKIHWEIDNEGSHGDLVLRLRSQQPLIESIATASPGGKALLLNDVDPVTFVTVGSRQGVKSDGWMVFFDRVHQRPYKTHQTVITPKQARLSSSRSRGTVVIEELTAGPFHGRLEFTVYAGSPLIKIDAVLQTSLDRRAILYDAGLVGAAESWRQVGWRDTDGSLQLVEVDSMESEPARAVKHRTMVASCGSNGTLAVFPPPHQFFYPLDNSTNLKFNWVGRGFHDEPRFGFGIRQHPGGDGRLVPWFNAPPGTEQRMSMFLLISLQDVEGTLKQVLEYTRGDRFKPLDGYRTFTSHYHVAHTMDVMRRRALGANTDDVPEFVSTFREMGVNIVHLAEFHGDGDARDHGPKRLPQLELMHTECDRLSRDDFLLLPGEEPNVHLGGHWMSFFPHPVYWIMKRQEGQPFVEEHPRFGRVYRVGSAAEMYQLLQREQGLAWTAHARIKGSHGYPDRHRDEPFFHSERFLGAAWKAMPADLSRDKTGERVLDLLDDMANWSSGPSQQSTKYVLGEVDVFKIDHTHELYGHMNINYLRLDELPSFRDGWASVLDVLRRGRFFVTTGEVLIPEFTVGGKQSGETIDLATETAPELTATIEGTFPLSFAEVISGDGQTVYRERVDLSDSPQFDVRTIHWKPNLTSRRWVRLEVWDIAANGAFTQPIWIK